MIKEGNILENKEECGFIADMHTHTLASSHAYSTITENAAWASAHGIKYLGMTDHGIQMWDAPHRWHFENLKILPRYIENVRIFRGMEANILDENGTLDIPDDYFYDFLEWINVSMHVQVIKPSTRTAHTKAYLNVLKNTHIDVISHSEDPKFDYDFDEVCRACADADKLIEINNCRAARNRIYAERYYPLLEACEKYGTKVIVNSDAHFYTYIGAFDAAMDVISKSGFPMEKVINSSEERFIAYLTAHNKNI